MSLDKIKADLDKLFQIQKEVFQVLATSAPANLPFILGLVKSISMLVATNGADAPEIVNCITDLNAINQNFKTAMDNVQNQPQDGTVITQP